MLQNERCVEAVGMAVHIQIAVLRAAQRVQEGGAELEDERGVDRVDASAAIDVTGPCW